MWVGEVTYAKSVFVVWQKLNYTCLRCQYISIFGVLHETVSLFIFLLIKILFPFT